MTKKIKITTLLIALIGLFNELKFLYFNIWDDQENYFLMILDFFSSINLNFANVNFFLTDNEFVYNYPNITFYLLLLLSIALYHFSKQKEIRLLRFLLSLQFLSNVISTLIIVTLFFIYRDEYEDSYSVYLLIFSLLIKVGFISLFYYFLRFFKENTTLDFTIKTIGSESQNLVVNTRNWQRLFHLIMDSFCIFLLFSFLWEAPIFKEEYMVYVFLFIIRTIYYTFFESLLNATPAKLLTGSRVSDEKGKTPKFQNIFTRTLSRFIPFDDFSFFGEKGWHDKLSNTYVVKEKRSGVKAKTYLLLFPIIITIFLSIYFSREAYQDYLYKKTEKQNFESNKKYIENQIKQLSSNTIIQIEPINYSDEYVNSDLYLKVEHITNNKITASLLIMKKKSLLKTEEFYDIFKSDVRKITFDKSELKKTYFTTYEAYKQTNVKGANLLKDGSSYELKHIHNLYDPKLELWNSMSYEDNKIIISLENKGWKTEFIEFKNNSGSIKWKIEQIEKIYSETKYLNYSLIGTPYKPNENIDLIIKMKNEYNKIHTYKLTGEYGNLHLEKVE